MKTLIEKMKDLADELPLKTHFTTNMPPNPPIDIPDNIVSAYDQNIYLKENLAGCLAADRDLKIHYWLINHWGGIGAFKKRDANDIRISKFREEISRGLLTPDSFSVISSLSKLSSFCEPRRYAIYDSRAVFALNWLIFRYCSEKHLFEQPSGRSADIARFNLRMLFDLSKTIHKYRKNGTAYHEYCELLQSLSEQVYGKTEPYFAEMLLFSATKRIVDDIEKSTVVTIGAPRA